MFAPWIWQRRFNDAKHFWRRFRRDGFAVFGLVVVIVALFVALFAPLLAPHDPVQQVLSERMALPSLDSPAGRDDLGRDIASRLIYGTRISVTIGAFAISLAIGIGVPLGAIAGYFGSRIDNIIMRTMDTLMAFPGIILAIVVVAVLGPSLTNAMIAVAIHAIPTFARIVRGSVLSVKESQFVMAARAIGCSHPRILMRHVLPNVTAPIIVQGTLRVSTVLLTAAALSYLGLGAQAPTPEWGAMLLSGQRSLRVAPHIAIFPGVAIMLLVMGFNALGDGLRDTLDPRLKR